MKKHIIIIAAVLALVMMSTVLLCACAPASNPEKAEAALNKHGYGGKLTTSIVVTSLAEGVTTAVYGVYTPENSDTTEGVVIIYFDSADHAKAAYNTIKEKVSALMTLMGVKESKEDSYWSFEMSGKMIWYGTKAGVKAAR